MFGADNLDQNWTWCALSENTHVNIALQLTKHVAQNVYYTDLTILNVCFVTHKLLLFPRSGVQNVQHIRRALLRFLCTYHAVAQTRPEFAIWHWWVLSGCFISYLSILYTWARFYSRNLFSAGSVVHQDPTERLHLMSGRCSPVKAKNVVPHDIGDPGRRKTISLTMSLRRCTHLISLFRQSKGFI